MGGTAAAGARRSGVAAHEAPAGGRAAVHADGSRKSGERGRTRGDQKDRPLVAGLREGNAKRSGGVTASAGRFGTDERGASGKALSVRSAVKSGQGDVESCNRDCGSGCDAAAGDMGPQQGTAPTERRWEHIARSERGDRHCGDRCDVQASHRARRSTRCPLG
ncbi:hypothetical protein ERJ75_000368600 [Trypanosoma vivax]|nr:hypothetical protein ERJ75_000368600 [Trypanosoma vivax]